ncbi:unnamed protein product [Penicillium salamii]|uniref:Uncharacterized protein n=1 Tax=Penicillium salamii TaxID=1612424 RepID=A0A9W4IJK0_9EURO|nr:unnamed protein product [Penicillium salamii]CAG8010591.1 unnamed protein product [Penicillium salamii]CAG8251644.1 unnamed protein product [Penicillium salamii]CAG8310566.1 unnamed protein product [Penicillium salamii]CAG8334510.1 unnamed protein product [Penicillium salamii]
MSSTPPPPSPTSLRVPRAPRFGPMYDDYEPYPTRYSTRLASQRIARAAHTTPPPSHPKPSTKKGVSKRTLSPPSPGTVKPSSKKAPRTHASSSSHTSPFNSFSSQPRTSARQQSRSSAERALPTPVKTPSKKKDLSSVTTTPRSLFPSTATSKRRKMDTLDELGEVHPIGGAPTNIFQDIAAHNSTTPARLPRGGKPAKVAIHTDSRDRIPQPATVFDLFSQKPESFGSGRVTRSNHVDEPGSRDRIPQAASVFDLFSQKPEGSGAGRVTRSNHVDEPGSRDRIPQAATVFDLFSQQPEGSGAGRVTGSIPVDEPGPPSRDGAWYVSRGQHHIYRKFDDMESDDDESDLGLFASRPDLLARNPDCLKGIKSLKRSEIKPKVLFPLDTTPLDPTPVNTADRVNNTIDCYSDEDYFEHEEDVTDVDDYYEGLVEDISPTDDPLLKSPPPTEPKETPMTSGVPGEDQVKPPSFGTGGVLGWLKSAHRNQVRALETPADRMKRHRETRGSPHPRTRNRTRKALRDEAEALVQAAGQVSAEGSTDV